MNDSELGIVAEVFGTRAWRIPPPPNNRCPVASIILTNELRSQPGTTIVITPAIQDFCANDEAF